MKFSPLVDAALIEKFADDRCPSCGLKWWLSPPAHIPGSSWVRCVECKETFDRDATDGEVK